MKLIDGFEVQSKTGSHRIELLVGDLTTPDATDGVDLLVVSAFPDDYTPSSHSLVGALHRCGVSVATLARDKEVDLREYASCWLSRPILTPSVSFQRILCFEPNVRGRAPEVVGDVFRSLVPFVTGTRRISRVAMPILASGDQGESNIDMLGAMVDAAAEWLSTGLPLETIRIVTRGGVDEAALTRKFAELKTAHTPLQPTPTKTPRFDIFVSYSQKNSAKADAFVGHLTNTHAGIRIFMDRLALNPGAAWQQQIFEALDDSATIICLLSPEYVASKICQEEFNMAMIRQRESGQQLLRPIYLYSAHLPTFMKAYQWIDAREADPERIRHAAQIAVG